MPLENDLLSVPNDWDRRGLPAWTYTSEDLLGLEAEHLFRSHWQIVCHVADLPEPGDFLTLDLCGERALVVRGRDGLLRAFHNLCRHRGSRVVAGERGNIRGAIICPFHGWTYDLDGCLRGVAHPKSLPPLDPSEWGLKPLEMEIWHGLIFVRFKPGPQPSVADLMARHEAEVAPYGIADMVACEPVDWGEESPVNWKAVRDVDNEGYHVAMAHPGLHDLYGRYYFDEAFHQGTSRSFATFNPGPGKLWSVRGYKSVLPEATWLPESHRRAWLYIGIFPNAVIGLYPDSVMFYQEFPLAVDRTRLRAAVYRRRDESRALRAARYLSSRIDRITAEEDRQLTVWSCEATRSSAYDGVMLSDLEYGVKSYHDHLRAVLPVVNLRECPPAGEIAAINERMSAERG
ncbi:aromatic ring-hydroxylating dioxygenase subunit alpha [Limibaculum sp. FT325]|uniref:aromatic ring-hydroxylating oxygenase subunit alpha n=1 Tax=Thermohalobaculum sediminis TaxID=2939436 RepID=UPI0020BDCD4C|nr:aromatic ring-hydroxylating dioxygenase subunit alpha [Limibaculum sediminis]MCL5778289.1 aromatic ring-hydroxylating dioxygenase subunit alpha [Limibaculum sediminis]